MENLQYGEILGEDRINSGFCWGIATGICYVILAGEGGAVRGCGAEHRQWRMQRGGAPAAVEKIEQASSAKIFSGTARRWGQMRLRLLLERICAQYGFGFFVQEKSKFVSSTASDRKGVVKGESVPLDRVLPTFARTKVGPRRAGVQVMPLQKAPRRRQAR